MSFQLCFDGRCRVVKLGALAGKVALTRLASTARPSLDLHFIQSMLLSTTLQSASATLLSAKSRTSDRFYDADPRIVTVSV
jgi:hypothetical protein